MSALGRAKQLRSQPTDAENMLGQQLRAHRLGDAKFKRQQPIGRYIVDFVCLERRLIIEADGGQHNDCATDVERDEWLRGQGFVLLRFWNNKIMQNLDGVLSRILEHLQPANTTLSPTPLPSREGK